MDNDNGQMNTQQPMDGGMPPAGDEAKTCMTCGCSAAPDQSGNCAACGHNHNAPAASN